MGSTGGVRDLVQQILDERHPRMNEDIIEDVFLIIEQTPAYRTKYESLKDDLKWWVVNNWIGRYVKDLKAAASIREVPATRTSLISGYTKLR